MASMPGGPVHGGMAHPPGGGGGPSDGGGGGPGYGPPTGAGQQQQQPGPGGQGGPGAGAQGGHPSQQQQQQQAAATKELNAAMLCRFGQETVQEIVARSLELFQLLKQTQPPDGKMNAIGMDRKTKFQETLKSLKAHFKRLRVIYEKIEENFPSNRDIPFEEEILNKSDDVMMFDEKRNTDSYKQAVDEYKEVMEHVIIKNRHLKEAIDHLRTMIWDVNTMLAMRKE